MRKGAWKHWALGAAGLLAGLASAAPAGAVPIPGGIDFQPPMTENARQIHAFHFEIVVIITAIVVFVMALLLWVMIRYNKRANPTPKKFSHNTLVEIVWTVVPVLILVWIAKSSFPLLYKQDVMFGGASVKEEEVVDIKVYGNTWYWDYTYNINTPNEFNVESRMLVANDKANPLKPERGDRAKLSVDNPMVAPAGRYVRLKISSKDVIHAWAMPQFMIKVDAVPGRLNQSWFKVDEPGVYYGQCSELCGKDHSNMPIELRIVTYPQFEEWQRLFKTSPEQARAFLDQVLPKAAQVASAQ